MNEQTSVPDPGTVIHHEEIERSAPLGAIVFAGCLLLAVGAATVQAFGFAGRAGLAPITVGVPTTIGLLFVFIHELRRFRGGAARGALKASPYFWIAIYLGTFFAFGALASLVIFTLTLTKFRGERTWKETIIFTVISGVVFFILIETILGESLYRGWFLELIR